MILGLESSCDESAVSLLNLKAEVKGEWVHSQIAKHAEYGGVVPDLAVGEHLENFFPLLEFAQEKLSFPKEIDSIAVTCGPGLVGCLGIGISIAKTLSLRWGVPLHGVNHLRGHAFSPFMALGPTPSIDWSMYLPHLGLLASGGNTLLFKIDEHRQIEVIARTVDDAVGEALDKGGKLLGIAYPGAAELEKYAVEGDEELYSFPRSIADKNDLRFSFSGLKTSLLYTLQKMNKEEVDSRFKDLCASYQKAAVDQLVNMTDQVLSFQNYKSLGLSGGVANNQKLRDEMKEVCERRGLSFLPSAKKHTGDNASMIAYCALVDQKGLWSNSNQRLSFKPSLKINDLENDSLKFTE